jgi:hypothetical protein
MVKGSGAFSIDRALTNLLPAKRPAKVYEVGTGKGPTAKSA